MPVPAEELDLDYQPQSTVNEQADTNEQTSFFEEDQAPEAADRAEPTPSPEKIPYSEIVAYLNDSTGKHFQATAVKTRDLIKARWRAHPNQDHFEKVIDTKTDQWLNDPTMNKFLRPETLFGPKFESYLNEGTTPIETDFEKYLKELE
ncbi:hypothetical protein CR203_22760 [Salipaludibacillus neizhouensis]|uniref:Phage conserved hypothetical protein C-terminal domain-containing protein n=1 Tax=Salipaludibacillus neizhouensis TaxID=885475 RepID=A0A3A9K1C9_9BACI|nr:hypothetical protein CR203_22760 [Salipaludibacillus neizhouensis]